MDPETLAEILAEIKISLFKIEGMLSIVLNTLTDTEENLKEQEENVEL